MNGTAREILTGKGMRSGPGVEGDEMMSRKKRSLLDLLVPSHGEKEAQYYTSVVTSDSIVEDRT